MKMPSFYRMLFLWSIFLLPGFAIGQKSDLPKQLKGLDAFVDQRLQEWDVPGLAIAVVQDGKVLLTKGYGLKDLESKAPVTEKTLFAIGSSSKAFTATAVMQLVDEQKVDLDEPVVTYLPDFKMYDDVLTGQLTVRDILSHRSGLPRHDLAWYGADVSREQLVERIQYLEPTAGLREAWQYQNFMYMLAGYLVGEMEGTTWEAFTQEHLFDPLQMKHSNFSVNEMQQSDDFAFPYAFGAQGVEKTDFRNLDAMGPAGSINSNAVDMAHWLLMQLGEGVFGTDTLLSAESLEETHRPQMVMPGGMEMDELFYNSYGLGWMITSYRGHLRVEHGGNIDGFSASVCLFPRDEIGIVVLTNMTATSLPGVVRNYIADQLLGLEPYDWNSKLLTGWEELKSQLSELENLELQDDPVRKKNTSPSLALQDYAGRFENPGYGTIAFSLNETQDSLRFAYNGFEGILQHYHFDVFIFPDGPGGPMKIHFQMDTEGEIVSVSLPLEPSLEGPLSFKRLPEAIEVSADELELYVGEYELMGATITVAIQEGSLTVTVPGQPTYTLVPSKKHRFDLLDVPGYGVLFTVEGEEASEITFIQPNGNFTGKRK